MPNDHCQTVFGLGLAALLILSACTDEPGAFPTGPSPAQAIVIPDEALLARRAAEVRARGEASFAQIADEAPTFGGYFFEGSTLVVLTKDASRGQAVRAAVASRSDAIRPRQGSQAAGDIEIRPADFSYSELADWRDAARRILIARPDVVSLDLNEMLNRVTMGVTPGRQRGGVEEAVLSGGIPLEAVVLTEMSGRLISDGDLQERSRPTQGGFQLRFEFGPNTAGPCTLGFNSLDDFGELSFITASHCSTPGTTPHPWSTTTFPWSAYQDDVTAPDLIAVEAEDPAPVFSGGFEIRRSDEARYRYLVPADSVDMGAVARTMWPPKYGFNATGSQDIDPSFPKFNITAEQLYPAAGQVVAKIGQSSGWTYGHIYESCRDLEDHTFNPPHLLLCQMTTNYGARRGDSGAAILVGALTISSSVTLVGTHAGRLGEFPPDTFAFFSPLGGIEYDLGPQATSPLPAPPPLSVSVEGPTEAPEHAEEQCGWLANTSGGSGTKTYQWKYDFVPVGTGSSWSGDTGTEGEHWLEVTVTDDTGNDTDGMTIQVSQFAECF